MTDDAGAGEAPFHDPHVTINRVYTKRGDAGETGLVGGQRVHKDDARIQAYGTVDELNACVGAARQSALEASASMPRAGVASTGLVGGAVPARKGVAPPTMTRHGGAASAALAAGTMTTVGKGGPGGPRAAGLEELAEVLLRVQHELFNLGSVLATKPEDLHPKQPRVQSADVAALEHDMDLRNESLAGLKSFVLPGGHRLNTDLHLARTVCRRAERWAVTLARHESVDDESLRYLNRLSDALFVWSRWASHLLGLDEVLWRPNVATSAAGRGDDRNPS
ncbi:MAG: cob(I)yrinic acid a,c-diamide adenosyltransferase [Myxococcota bacterium]